MQFLEDVVLRYDGNECLIWPYARDGKGYGAIVVDGDTRVVPRLVCERVNGSPPTTDHETAHSCGKGHEGCTSPGHLSWKTRSGNQMDKVTHDTHSRGERSAVAKITNEQAKEILALKGKMLQREIAKMYGITRGNVGRIHRGFTWGWIE